MICITPRLDSRTAAPYLDKDVNHANGNNNGYKPRGRDDGIRNETVALTRTIVNE